MKVEFTIAAEAANAKAVTVQLKQSRYLDRNVGSPRVIGAFVSTDADGTGAIDLGGDDVVPSAGASGEILTGLDAASEQISEFRVLTDADGTAVVVLTNASDEAKTRYLNVVLPDGKVVTSAAVTFADDTP